MGVLASVLPPSDVFVIFVDGVKEKEMIDVNEWQEITVDIPAGRHVIDFSYQYNLYNVDPLPPSPPNREGAVYIDDIVLAETASLSRTSIRIEDIFLGRSQSHTKTSGGTTSTRVPSGW
eukprot:CAMPEP_0172318502 /NCGR_PEP_ID=MMETSP1058-20130122/35080_1 /TAXON_ID=83371 /ORGANISM="Detonula confervacea, Strain CCMP 353" /LENGTH=118 /DNA_ID=CAMNT_0013033351 /DNA_START=105 /DNA_END=458 /DNA_ORIENTATION=+